MPWPPGSTPEPSCSQRSRGTSLPELLQFLPDLTPSQLSFVLLGMGADLTHPWGLGSSIRASVPQGPPCHTVTAVLRDQDKVLLPAPVFSYGICTGKFHHPPGNDAAPRAQRGFPAGGHVGWFCCLWLLFLFWILHSPLQRLMLELKLIFLVRSVLLSSSHSTFQSILGTIAAQLHPAVVLSPKVFV